MNSNKRHLLEMAAKVAGINYRIDTMRDGSGVYRIVEMFHDGHAEWDPIEDDGDAFRLSLASELNTFCVNGYAYALLSEGDMEDETKVQIENGDRAAAMRLAITQCAAWHGERL